MTKSEKDSPQPSQDHIKLFIPGPSEVKGDILAAQSQWMVGHRMPECADLIANVSAKLNEVFRTSGRVLITCSSGTGLQEAAVRNCSDKKVLNCVNGAFSQRWSKVTESNGKANSVLEGKTFWIIFQLSPKSSAIASESKVTLQMRLVVGGDPCSHIRSVGC